MMTITKEQYNSMAGALIMAERLSLDGNRAQVFFDIKSGKIWITSLAENERYTDNGNYIKLYAVDGWEDKLKDLYEDNNADVDWDDENYKFTDEYAEFERWYFDDCVDGFNVFEILDEALEQNGITVEE